MNDINLLPVTVKRMEQEKHLEEQTNLLNKKVGELFVPNHEEIIKLKNGIKVLENRIKGLREMEATIGSLFNVTKR